MRNRQHSAQVRQVSLTLYHDRVYDLLPQVSTLLFIGWERDLTSIPALPTNFALQSGYKLGYQCRAGLSNTTQYLYVPERFK